MQEDEIKKCKHPYCGRFYDHNAKKWSCRALADGACACDDNCYQKPEKTDEEIVKQANELARRFYAALGYQMREEYKFYEATHPQEIMVWNMAVEAYEYIECTDVEDVLDSFLDC